MECDQSWWCSFVLLVNDKDLAKELYKQYSSVDQENVEKVTSSLHISIYVPENDKDSILIYFASKTSNARQITSKLHIIGLGAQPGKPSFTKKQAYLFFPPDFADDFLVAMQEVSQVLLATVNETTLVPFVSDQLNNLELAVNLANRGNLPGSENLRNLIREATAFLLDVQKL